MINILKNSLLLLLIVLTIFLNANLKIYKYHSKNLKNIKVQINLDNKTKIYKTSYGTKYIDLIYELNLNNDYEYSIYDKDLLLYNNQIIELRKKGNYISINKSDLNELISLPGIGETIAKRIIEYRITNNGFKYIEELMNVSGIGKKKYEKIKEHIIL